MSKPVAWEGAEEWEPLAWELCADEHGEECCHDLIWDMGGVIPEPWGERWQKYEDEAKRMISMVRKCTHSVKELTPCEELREFQEQQNGVFSEHNACCYRHECRIVWNDWEEIRSNPAELMDEEIAEAISEIVDAIGLNDDCMDEYWVNRGIEAFKAILRKAQEK